MARLRQLGGPMGDDDEHAHRTQSVGKVAEQIDRRGIGPVEVVEEEHDRVEARRFVEQRGHLPLHPACRTRPRLVRGPLGLIARASDLRVPVRRHGPGQPRQAAVRLGAQQRVERLERRRGRPRCRRAARSIARVRPAQGPAPTPTSGSHSAQRPPTAAIAIRGCTRTDADAVSSGGVLSGPLAAARGRENAIRGCTRTTRRLYGSGRQPDRR